MSHQILEVSVPARMVLGQRTFTDGRPPIVVVTLAFWDPFHPEEIAFVGVGNAVEKADGFLLPRAGGKRREGHLGRPFGTAVIEAQSSSILAKLRATMGEPLSEIEITMLLAPLLGRAYRGEVVIAGVKYPPDPDPCWQQLHPLVLPYWTLVPGADEALPTPPAADHYVQLRAFTPAEWLHVQAHGGRLPLQSADTQVSSASVNSAAPLAARPEEAHRLGEDEALAWMIARAEAVRAQHGRPPKRYTIARACFQETGFPARQARKLEERFPGHLKNPRKG